MEAGRPRAPSGWRRRCWNCSANGARDPLFLALAEALVRTLSHADRDQEAGALADRRLHRFRHLVELHYREHRPLDFYAGALGMTRRTLSG
jgi:AraC family transcriptional activator of pobA